MKLDRQRLVQREAMSVRIQTYCVCLAPRRPRQSQRRPCPDGSFHGLRPPARESRRPTFARAGSRSSSEVDEVAREFLLESSEGLDRLDRNLVALERSPADRERIASSLRTIHTIEGTCGFLGLSKLESIARVGESLLTRLRVGRIQLTTEIATSLLALVDAVLEVLAAIETTGK